MIMDRQYRRPSRSRNGVSVFRKTDGRARWLRDWRPGASRSLDPNLPPTHRGYRKCYATRRRVYCVVIIFEHSASGQSNGVPCLRQPARIIEREEWESTAAVLVHAETGDVALGHVGLRDRPDREQEEFGCPTASVRDRLDLWVEAAYG